MCVTDTFIHLHRYSFILTNCVNGQICLRMDGEKNAQLIGGCRARLAVNELSSVIQADLLAEFRKKKMRL